MFTENPKTLAHQLADGLIYLTPHSIRKFSPQERQMLIQHLQHLQIEIRGEFCEQNDFRHIQKKNQKLQHIRMALQMLQHHETTEGSHGSDPTQVAGHDTHGRHAGHTGHDGHAGHAGHAGHDAHGGSKPKGGGHGRS